MRRGSGTAAPKKSKVDSSTDTVSKPGEVQSKKTLP
jgi:hypothetical protein